MDPKLQIDRQRRRLVDLEAQQANLKERLANVRQALTVAKLSHGKEHNSRIPAIRVIPPNILSHICLFLHSSQTLWSTESDDGKKSRRKTRFGHSKKTALASTTGRAEVVVSHVCHNWRDVAVHTPALWCVYWCDKPQSCRALITETRRFDTYLSRSGQTVPLELYFDFTWKAPEIESISNRQRFNTLASELFGLARPHSRRWKALSIVANDMSGRVVLRDLQRQLMTICVPLLESLVICVAQPTIPLLTPETSGSEPEKLGWDQIMLLQEDYSPHPCPSLRYLKLDRGSLALCRPPISGALTHLALEHGTAGGSLLGGPRVKWDALLSSELLRLPRLETVSLSEDVIIGPITICGAPEDDDKPASEPPYLEMEELRHLRIGWHTEGRLLEVGESTGQFLWYLLRYLTAPKLETLTMVNYELGRSPWPKGLDRLKQIKIGNTRYHSGEPVPAPFVFPSIHTLILSNVSISPSYLNDGDDGFARLEDVTKTACHLIISQELPSDYISLTSDARFPWLPPLCCSFIRTKDRLCPDASEISMNLSYESNSQNARETLEMYQDLRPRVKAYWTQATVFRIPPAVVDAWINELEQPELASREYLGGDNYVWARWSEGVEEKAPPEEEATSHRAQRDLMRIEPIRDVHPQCWPPSRSSVHNTMQSECFLPWSIDSP